MRQPKKQMVKKAGKASPVGKGFLSPVVKTGGALTKQTKGYEWKGYK